MNQQKKRQIKFAARSRLDLQKQRIAIGNRLVAGFRTKLGYDPDQGESSDREKQKILNSLRKSYDSITEGVNKITLRRSFDYDSVISTYTELVLVQQWKQMKDAEEEQTKQLRRLIKDVPIWEKFLKDVKGVGPVTGAAMIGELDMHKAKYAGSIWAYCGLDVKNGEGRCRKKSHRVKKTAVKENGEVSEYLGLTFDPDIKTTLLGKLAPSFLQQQNEYADVYYNYKNRLENSPKHADKDANHIHAMARRYMIKMFLIDLYEAWRPLEGLPVHDPYHEAKLGLNHGEDPAAE